MPDLKASLIGVQMDIAWEDKEANHTKVRALLEADPPRPGSLVVLPEMFSTGFSMNLDAISETSNPHSEGFLCEIARQFGVNIVAGVVTTPDLRGRNEAIVVSQEGVITHRYQKLQPFVGGEKSAYAAGERIVRFDWMGVRVCPFVCFDLRFPELFRSAAVGGADLMLVIASWPEARIGHWTALLQARAIENQCYVLGVNRTGRDPYFPYTGRSMIVDYSGAVVADAGEAECLIQAEIDLPAMASYRARLPFLAEIRPELIGGP